MEWLFTFPRRSKLRARTSHLWDVDIQLLQSNMVQWHRFTDHTGSTSANRLPKGYRLGIDVDHDHSIKTVQASYTEDPGSHAIGLLFTSALEYHFCTWISDLKTEIRCSKEAPDI